MKSFIIAALLVAAVAGQSMDMMKWNKDSSKALLKFDRPMYPWAREHYKMGDNYEYNYNQIHGGDYDYETTTTTYYTLEEIMEHPLFREYMTLPLFRQYWSYPTFQKYVASMYFQRFWQIPVFKQYFIQPTLFYKYIYPIVTLFKYDTTTMNTYGDWIWNKNTYGYNYGYPYNTEQNYYYGQQQRDLPFHKMMPTVCYYNSVYCKALFEKLYTHISTMMMTYGQEEMMMPMDKMMTMEKMMYNPYITRMMEKYYNRYPSTYETERMTPYTYETEKMMTPYTFNKERMFQDKIHFTPEMKTKMMEEIFTPVEAKYEHIRPIMMKSFDKKIMPETMIKA